jgi:hypothetical protein
MARWVGPGRSRSESNSPLYRGQPTYKQTLKEVPLRPTAHICRYRRFSIVDQDDYRQARPCSGGDAALACQNTE